MDEISENNLGGLLSPKDERDFPEHLVLGAGVGYVPDQFLPNYSSLPVYNQLEGPGSQTSCGPAAGAKLINILFGIPDELSYRFIACLAVKISGIPLSQGTNGRTIMQVLQKYGVPLAKYFPNDNAMTIEQFSDYTKIPPEAYADALSRRIGPYTQLSDLSPSSVRNAIYRSKAVFILKSLWTPSSWSSVNSGCGHFNDGNGYDVVVPKTRFANSFGKNWGSQANGGGNGDGYYLDTDFSTIREAWVASLPSTPPSPPAPVLPSNPSVPQELDWLSKLTAWLKSLLSSLQK